MRISEAKKLKEGDIVITPHGFPLTVCSISEFNSPLGRNTINCNVPHQGNSVRVLNREDFNI